MQRPAVLIIVLRPDSSSTAQPARIDYTTGYVFRAEVTTTMSTWSLSDSNRR